MVVGLELGKRVLEERERAPDAEWVLFEDSGHSAILEEPARYRDVLRGFLSRVEAGSTV